MFGILSLICLAITLICLIFAAKIAIPARDSYRQAYYFIVPGIIFGILGTIFGLLAKM